MSRWTIIEKEAYAIIASCNRLEWLLQRSDGFSLFTDHHNLLYVFNPNGTHGSHSAHSAAKLIRWALRLSSYRYTIEHVSGIDNVWSDMLTRWAAPPSIARISTLMLAPVAPNLDPSFSWPTAAEILCIQNAARVDLDEKDDAASQLAADGLYRMGSGQVWIPAAAHALHLRICIVAHTGPGGHRGVCVLPLILSPLFSSGLLSKKTCAHSVTPACTAAVPLVVIAHRGPSAKRCTLTYQTRSFISTISTWVRLKQALNIFC